MEEEGVMAWDELVRQVIPYIFKIETPSGHGTGFLCVFSGNGQVVGVATANHVVDDADKWQQPIRLIPTSGEPVFLKQPDYSVFANPRTDSALILLPAFNLHLPESLIELIPPGAQIPVGSEVAWLGYPVIEPATLCFFSGSISAWMEARKAYLIDGVAIHGVSGGPVIYRCEDSKVRIVGIVTLYRANRATGEALPGLLYAQDVSHFQKAIVTMRNIEEAQTKKQEFEQQKPSTLPANPMPEPDSPPLPKPVSE